MSRPPEHIPADSSALFLDVDGTLVDIEDDPAAVHADDELLQLLQDAAAKLDGALALVSGRSLSEIDRMFSSLALPAAGAHGSEIRINGSPIAQQEPPAVPAAIRRDAERFVADRDGLLLEQKTNGFSLHYRRAPALADDSRDYVSSLLARLGEDFRLIEGKMVLEIAPRSHSKGEAIRVLLDQAPFRNRVPVFVGDDVTDEDGFRAANEYGGLSVCVGDRRDSDAHYRLPDVAAVRRWLGASIA